MAEKNKNSSRNKLVRKKKIINLVGYLTGKTHFPIPGLTNHIGKLYGDNIRHLCHIMKSVSMDGFQIETFEELKQFVSKIDVPISEISIREKEKKCFEVTNQLEEELRYYNLYDILFKLNNSVDEEEELLNHIRNNFWIPKSIKKWKERVHLWMKCGEIKQGTWAEWYIQSVAEKQGINGKVREGWKKLMNEAYQLRCNYENAKKRYAIYNCLLFEMQNNDESKKLKQDLQRALQEESDAYNPPDNLPDDYFLIKSGIITDLDQFINIMELCIKKKVYLCLDITKFKKTIIERLIGKTKLFEMLENATTEQIKKILDIDVKMDEIYRSVYNLSGCESTFHDLLYSSHNSKAIENIIDCATENKELFLTTFPNASSNLLDFCWHHLQISVEKFEKFLSKCSLSSSWNNGNVMNWVEALSIGIKCCSDDMQENGKKINLGHIFPDWRVFFKTITGNDVCWEYDDCCVELMSDFFNLLFKNIDKIKLDDKQMGGFLFDSIHNKYGYKVDGFMDALRCEQKAATENNSDNKFAKMAIVINAILKKQNLEYKDRNARKCNIQEWFENECKKIGISVSCDQDDIFFENKTLYLVDKNVGVSQFDDGLVFLAYVYKNISKEKGQHYAALLGDYICKNNFSIFDFGNDNYIRDNYFFIICLLLNVLKNHNGAKAKVKKLYVDDKLKSKWQKFRFMLYNFIIFYFVCFVCFTKQEDLSRFISTITFDSNKKNIFPSKQIEIGKISTDPDKKPKLVQPDPKLRSESKR